MSININNINKFYGKQQALTDVSFTLNKGEIVGFLGPNGAGKSTLMKIITCYLQQDSGKVKVCNLDTQEQDLQVKAKIGYLPEHNPLYTDMYIKEYLTFVGGIYKVENLNNRIAEIITQTGLTPEQSKKIGELSKGFKQRVGLAAALIHDPEILILDEPTTGLDPNQLVEIRNLIKEVGKDKTVLLSTHIMQEVDKMCNRVIIINKGKIVDDQLISNYQKNDIDLEDHFRKLTA
jgi:ABC-2 type transport system ATP-binding protein